MPKFFPLGLMLVSLGLVALPAAAGSGNGQLQASLTISARCSAASDASGMPLACSPGVVMQRQMLLPAASPPLAEDERQLLQDFYPQPGGYAQRPSAPAQPRLLLSF